MTTEERFEAAVKIIRSLPKDGPFQPSNDMALKFYGLYKQAVEGPCKEPKPAFYEVVKGYKWRAWNNLGNMSKHDAMFTYVEELKKIVETMSYTENVANFMDALGPFYEYVEIAGLKPKNNNTKGLEDSPSFSAASKSDGGASALTNGNPRRMNGAQNSDVDSGSEEAPTSSQDSSPELMSIKSNGTASVPLRSEQLLNGNRNDDDDEEDDYDEELVVMKVHNIAENTTTHTLSLSSRVHSDSDTDEEYSEPAEISIDYPMMASNMSSQFSSESTVVNRTITESSPSTSNGSVGTPNDPVTCGGGDQSHPGGLQMTARQTHGSGYSATSFYTSGDARGLSAGQMGSLVRSSGSGGGAGGSGGRRGSSTSISEDVNTQLVVLLRRLQNDMENVLHRLNTLETLTVTQHHSHCHHCQVGSSSSAAAMRTERSWWPFPELSPRSTFFLLIWPLLLHGGIKLLLVLRSRRRRQ